MTSKLSMKPRAIKARKKKQRFREYIAFSRKAKKRIVLGQGHPWFSNLNERDEFTKVYLTTKPMTKENALDGLTRVGLPNVFSAYRCRLVLEVL